MLHYGVGQEVANLLRSFSGLLGQWVDRQVYRPLAGALFLA